MKSDVWALQLRLAAWPDEQGSLETAALASRRRQPVIWTCCFDPDLEAAQQYARAFDLAHGNHP